MSVFITGYSLRAPNSNNVKEFYQNLKNNTDMTSKSKRYNEQLDLPKKTGTLNNIEKFDNEFFKFNINQVDKMDPSIRLLLEITHEALLDSRLSIKNLRGSNTGVYIGHCFSDYFNFLTHDKITGNEVINSHTSMAAGKISHFYDLKGPSYVTDTACSSSMVALENAFKDITFGNIDRAIVGGISLNLNPKINEMFYKYKMLSPDGICYSFDSKANGYCRSEGIGVVILESNRICDYGYCKIEGILTNSDGYTSKGITHPNYQSQADLGNRVIKKNNIDINKIGFIEAHGTGTTAGDSAELKSLSIIFNEKKNCCPIGSVKSNMGHSEGASGMMSLIKCLIMYETKKIFANLNYNSSNHIFLKNKFRIVTKNEELPDNCYISISNYGFTGTNVFTVLSPGNINFENLPNKNKISFSNNLATTDYTKISNLYLENQILLGNEQLFKNKFVDNKKINNSEYGLKNLFLFTGQGTQWKNMGKILIEKSVIFKKTIERLSKYIQNDLLELYLKGDSWFDRKNSILGIISYEIGLVNILKNYGIQLDKCIGHSLGEICCAYITNYLNEEQAIKIAEIRGNLVSKFKKNKCILVTSEKYDLELCVNNFDKKVYYVDYNHKIKDDEIKLSMDGKMTFIVEDLEIIKKTILNSNLKNICIACYNNPKSYTISGEKKQIDELKNILKSKKMIDLDTDGIAYHSPILKYFEEYLDNEFLKIIGNKTEPLNNKWISTSNCVDYSYKYFTKNIINPVYFEQSINKLGDKKYKTIEIGPKSFLNRCVNNIETSIKTFHIINNDKDELSINDLHIKLWKNCFILNGKIDKSKQSSIEFRYLDFWNHEKNHRVLNNSFVNKNITNTLEKKNTNEVIYQISQTELNWIDGHFINNELVLPGTFYLYLIWKLNNFSDIKITDFNISKKIIITKDNNYELKITKENNEYKFYHKDNLSASAIVKDSINLKIKEYGQENIINTKELPSISDIQFYNYFKKNGYHYENDYRSVEKLDYKNKVVKIKEKINIIAYLDSILQFILLNNKFLLPIGIENVKLSNYNNRINIYSFKKINKTFYSYNKNVIFENIKIIELPIKSEKKIILNSEIWIKYCNNEFSKLKYFKFILQDIVKNYKIKSSLNKTWDSKIEEIVKKSIKNQNKSKILICNNFDNYFDNFDNFDNFDFLITGNRLNQNKEITYILSFDEQIFFYSLKKKNYKIVDNFKDIVKKENILWKNSNIESGIIGGVKSLKKEGYSVSGYYFENTSQEMIGIEKNMNYNHVKKNGEHGIFLECSAEKYISNNKKYNLVIEKPGNLNSFQWIENNYSTKVSYSALNFRDIMRSYGRLKEDDKSIGLEFSGYDSFGNKIIGVGKNTIGSYCDAFYTYPLPDYIKLDEGASIMITYLTAYYCLFEKCNLKKGDSVLIHSGSGGVGMSCINLCLSRGIKIFTTCSENKREFIKSNFNLKDNQIGDSRSLSFEKLIMSETNFNGVDAVINSLAGEYQITSLNCLANYGNFCEIGKYDILNHTNLDQFLLEKNISFHVIDLLPMLKNKKFHCMWDKYLSEGFRQQEIKPLPTRVFNKYEVKEAFRFMAQGKHIGKILIKNDNTFEDNNIPNEIKPHFSTNGIHVISGGLGGLGLQLAIFLGKCGAEKILLISRSGIKNQFQQYFLDQVNCEVEILIKNVNDIEHLGNIETIWHLASTSQDVLFRNMNDILWNEIYNVKVNGYLHFRKLYPTTKIVAFGSVVSLHGNIGQVHYSYSNNCLKNLIRNDSNGYIIELGPIDNLGMAVNLLNKKNNEKLVLKDYDFLPVDEIFKMLDNCYLKKNKILSFYISSTNSEILNIKNKTLEKTKNNINLEIIKKIQKSKNNLNDGIKKKFDEKKIIKKLVEYLGGDDSDYDTNTPLFNYGLDSLTTMELLDWIKNEVNVEIQPTFIVEETTINHIYKEIVDNSNIFDIKKNEEDTDNENEISNVNEIQDNIKNYHKGKNFSANKIIIKLVEYLGGNENDYDIDTPLINYGLDSLTTMELLEWVKNEVNLEIEPTFIGDETTINDICNEIIRNPNEKNLTNKEKVNIKLKIRKKKSMEFDFFNDRLSLLKLWEKKESWINKFLEDKNTT